MKHLDSYPMTEHALLKKLLVKPEKKILILNAPQGFIDQINMKNNLISEESKGSYDFVMLFAYLKSDLEHYGPIAIQSILPDGLLWIAYPKGTSKLKTDINRDNGWDIIHSSGYKGVSLISIDNTWSAMRFREGVEDRQPANKETKEQNKTITVPPDLQKLLDIQPLAKSVFDKLAYTHRKEYVIWIKDAKKPETREKRLQKTIELLAEGKKSR